MESETHKVPEDSEERERRQEKHYHLFKELQSMSSELPM